MTFGRKAAQNATTVACVSDAERSCCVRRYFTIPCRDPFDEIEWEIRDAFIPGKDGPVFEQKSVEFLKFWSQTATNIVAQKYFRGPKSWRTGLVVGERLLLHGPRSPPGRPIGAEGHPPPLAAPWTRLRQIRTQAKRSPAALL